MAEVDETRREMIIASAKKAKDIKKESDGKRNKVEYFSNMMETITFKQARAQFMFSMKMLLTTADHSELEDLKVAYEINQKMARRLQAIITIRKEEEKAKKEHNEDTLFDLLDSFNEE